MNIFVFCVFITDDNYSTQLNLFTTGQYFLNPKVAKEPVPPQLELIAKEILVPMLRLFHQLAQKVLWLAFSVYVDYP